MLITGNLFTDLLSFLTLALPLLSVCFILFRKEYTNESLTLVMLLCLFHFIQRLLIQYNNLLEFNSPILYNVFNALEFLLLASVFRSNVPSKRFRIVIHSFVIAYLSSTITYFAIEGMDADQYLLRIIQNGLVIALMGFVIYHQYIRPQQMPMQTPLFWISLGTIFYFAFSLFWESGKEYLFSKADAGNRMAQNFVLVSVAIRFMVYAVAIWYLEPSHRHTIKRDPARAQQVPETADSQPQPAQGRVRFVYGKVRPSAVPAGRNG
jgi:hypothetical protein